MTADERLELIGAKVKRAEHHFIDLEREIGAFLSSKPYRVVKNVDAKSKKHRYEISHVRPVAPQIVSITGNIIQNLRSSLDHLTNQLLLVGLGVTGTNQEFNFPCSFDSPQKHKAFFEGKVQNRLRADALDAIKRLNAYKGGKGHAFWVLNRLNNIDKHRMVVAVGSFTQSMNIGSALMSALRSMAPHPVDLPNVPIFLEPTIKLCPLQVGDVVADWMIDGMEMNEETDFSFGVAFNEPEICESKPLIETIQHLGDLVAGTIRAFKPYLA